jgi:phage-related minor tail protein
MEDGSRWWYSTTRHRPELVGERGPELFVPNSSGSIKTNADTKSAMGGGGGVNLSHKI